MTLYVTGPSAIEYWRKRDPSEVRRSRAALPFGVRACSEARGRFERDGANLSSIENAGLGWLARPIHLLVPSGDARKRCAWATCHVLTRSLPEGSFVKISQDVLVSSPELACVSVANAMRFPFFVELLYELCGNYRLSNEREGGCIEMPPATSISELVRYATRVQGVRGANLLMRALRYVCDNSLSPMETDITATMLFDPRMGGFGLAKPRLNPRFEVSGKDRRALPQSAYLPDLYWAEANVSVEYDSDKHHRGSQKISEDAIRRNGIEHLGTRVITLTWEQARNYYEFERVALLVARALGKRFSPEWERWKKNRIELHRLLVRNRVRGMD